MYNDDDLFEDNEVVIVSEETTAEESIFDGRLSSPSSF